MENTNVKMTQRDYYNEIVALAEANDREDIVAFAKGRIEMLNKKSNSKSKAKNQEQNEAIKATILSTLEVINRGTVTDILTNGNFEVGTSNQKISAMLRQMAADGLVTKAVEKKKSYFTLAADEVED